MTHRIILLSDGTGNAASKVWRTNVWRIYEFLDLSRDDQVAKYDDGVGSSSFKPLALLGGAFGWGLKRNVIDLYKFASRNYRAPTPGDPGSGSQIYGFGFSRGAYTIRILVGLILDQGLIPYQSEASLNARAHDAYRAFRAKGFHSVSRVEWLFRKLRDGYFWVVNSITGRAPYNKADNIVVPAIEFVGIWDTVAAYGLPIDEMTRGFSQWIWPLELPERVLNPKVKRACHALALDDERTTFHPVLWTEAGENRPAPDSNGTVWLKDERISQVWFSGAHSNVGGGYPDDALAYFPLLWVMEEARARGLVFKTPPADPDAFRRVQSSRDADGRQYDSRAGLGAYYRYGPRKIADLCQATFSRRAGDSVSIALPKIHQSALARLRHGGNAYAPVGFPAHYEVVTFDGRLIPMHQADYETAAEACARAGHPNSEIIGEQERVWNLIWYRRMLYFLTFAASFHLGAFWLFHDQKPEREFSSSIRLVSETVRLVEAFLPYQVVRWWTSYYAANPRSFLIGVLVLALLIYLGSKLGVMIFDTMRTIWLNRSTTSSLGGAGPHLALYRVRTSAPYQATLRLAKRHVLPFLSAVVMLWLAAAASSHFLFNVIDSTGLFCQKTKDDQLEKLMEKGQRSRHPIEFSANALCFPTGVYVQQRAKYSVTITEDPAAPWSDDGVPHATHPNGFRTAELPDLHMKAMKLALLPFRRALFRRWFTVIARVGDSGTYEDFLDPSLLSGHTYVGTTATIRRSGELFLYVNQATIGLPGISDLFYRNNRGKAHITIERL